MLDPAQAGQVFTEEGAWQFVVMLLESGHPVEEITLAMPPGKKGYVLKYPRIGLPDIYIKLQIVSGAVRGRSFHDSTN